MIITDQNRRVYSFLIHRGLTKREIEVSVAVASGKLIKEAAEDMNIGNQTVKFHLTNIYKKLKIKRKKDLAQMVLNLSEDSQVW